MGFWSWLTGGDTSSITPNGVTAPPGTVGPTDWSPGDPDGVVITDDGIEGRALPSIFAAPWSGYPAGWETPGWGPAIESLADTAWDCIDLNSRVLSTMPVYKTRGGRVAEPESWMANPDPRLYNSWQEFAKQLFRDYQLGEAFVLATDYFSNGYPMFMSLLPPPFVTIEGFGSSRRYRLGSTDITADVLHIRYSSSLQSPRGVGPLDVAGARLTASCVLARYISDMVTAPPPFMTLETDADLNAGGATSIMTQWIESRTTYRGYPAVLDKGFKLNTHQMNAKDMALLELAQFTDSRIAVKCGVPPPLVGLPTGDSMTYSTVSGWTDHHDRLALRPFATAVMSALSNWALPPDQTVEIDRDEYSRPSLPERVTAWEGLHRIGAVTAERVADLEISTLTTGRPVTASESRSSSDARSLSVAEVVQKVYLGVVNGVITRDEARQMIRDAGGVLSDGGGS